MAFLFTVVAKDSKTFQLKQRDIFIECRSIIFCKGQVQVCRWLFPKLLSESDHWSSSG